MQVSAKGSHVSLEGVTFADMESCSVHVLNRGTAQLRSCQLCSLRGYSLVVKGVASAAAVQDCCFVGGVDAASGYGGPTRVQGPESSSGVHVMHGGIVELLTTPGVIPGPRGLDMSPPLSGLMSGHHGTASVSSGGGGGGIVAGTRHSWAGQQQQQGQQMGGSAIRTHTAMRGGVGRVERTLVSSEGVFTP